MKTKILSILLVLLIIFSSVACNDKGGASFGGGQGPVSNQTPQNQSNQLQLLKSDFKLPESDMVNRIKAEYLLENDGYKSDDEIIVMVALESKSLLDRYLDDYQGTYNSVGDLASSSAGKAIIKSIDAAQNALIRQLDALGLIREVTATYNTIINAIAVKICYG